MTDQGGHPQQVLTDEILADARRQAERTLARAKRDAKDITDKAQVEADAGRDERLAAAHQEAERRRQLALATVPIEIARMRAARIEEILQSIHDEALRRLIAREGFDYRETVTALAAAAAAQLEGDTLVLELAVADIDALGDGLADAVRRRLGRDGLEVRIAPEPAGISAGVIVRDAEGRQVWDNSLQGRLARLWPMLRREIAAQIAPDGADAPPPAPDEKES